MGAYDLLNCGGMVALEMVIPAAAACWEEESNEEAYITVTESEACCQEGVALELEEM